MIDYTDLIGTPFKNRGRDVKAGLDCYGLVMEVFKRNGIIIPEYTAEYTDMKRINCLVRENTQGYPWLEIPKSDLVVPSLIAIRFGSPDGVVNHTGAYIGEGKFIHIRENIGVCIDRIDSIAWKRVIVGFYRYVGESL